MPHPSATAARPGVRPPPHGPGHATSGEPLPAGPSVEVTSDPGTGFERNGAGTRQPVASSSEAASGTPIDAARRRWTDAFKDLPNVRIDRTTGVASPGRVEGRVPPRAEVDRVLSELRSNPAYAWLNISDGCNARAHLIAERLSAPGSNINNMKVFLKDTGNPQNPQLGTQNAFFRARWDNHVAVAVEYLDPDTRKLETGIIDFAVSDQLLAPKTWMEAVNQGSRGIIVDVMPSTQYDHPMKDGIQAASPDHTTWAWKRLNELSKALNGPLKPLPRTVFVEGRPVDTTHPKPLLDATGSQVGWQFPQYDYDVRSTRGATLYQRRPGSEREGERVDLEGKPLAA